MRVNGFKIFEAMNLWQLRKTALEQQFNNSLAKYKNETKRAPAEIDQEIKEAERAIVLLQVAQDVFNSLIKVKFGGEEISLNELIKRLGVCGRSKKRWSHAATYVGGGDDQSRRYRNDYRETTQEYPVATIVHADALKAVETATKEHTQLRAVLAEANGRTVEVVGLDEKLFI